MNIVLLFTQLKFLELWLSQKRLAPCCACTCGKRSKHIIEDMNFETRQRCGTCPVNKFHAPTHTHGILTPGDSTQTGVVATWSLGENHPMLWLFVSSGENHPTLWLV